MKKIIGGKLYDTDKARRLGGDGGGDGFGRWGEELYQKRTGEFFLHGEGGPMTKYAESIGQNQWSGGEKIIPLSYEKAREWAEEHLSADKYAEVFGMPSEDDERVTLCIQVSATLAAQIRAKAAENNMNLTAYITKALEKTL